MLCLLEFTPSQSRHELIEIFLENPGWFFDVMEQLTNFVDLDRLLVRWCSNMALLRMTNMYCVAGSTCSDSKNYYSTGFADFYRKCDCAEANTGMLAKLSSLLRIRSIEIGQAMCVT